MENLELVWKEAVTNESYSKELGQAYKVFVDKKYFIVAKDNNRKAVVMFKDTVNNKIITVIMQNAVNQLYRQGKISLAQLFSLPVVRMEKLEEIKKNDKGEVIERKLITDEPTFWLGAPNMGWQDVLKAVVEVTNLEDLAV